jgi:hypothetical protein
MSYSIQSVQGLLDIEPPLPPGDSSLLTAISLFAVIAAGLLAIIFLVRAIRQYLSYRAQARRRIRHLRNSLPDKTGSAAIDSNEVSSIAYQLARALAIGLGVNSISSSTTLPAELSGYAQRWQDFSRQLDMLRYAKPNNDTSALHGLCCEADFWLQKWPR